MATVENPDENLPDFVSGYNRPARMSVHDPAPEMVWAHSVQTMLLPHTHIIVETWDVELKNKMANHIEQCHKNRR